MQSVREMNIRRMSELDRLPWFETGQDGQLQLRTGTGLPPILDVHAHVGWSYGFAPPIAYAARRPIQYLYDYERDQDVIFECKHPYKDEAKILTKDMYGSFYRYVPSSASHTAANLIAEMDRFNTRHACLLPIEGPVKSRHAEDTMKAAGLSERLIPFAAVHPWRWGRAQEDRLRNLMGRGAKAVKFHPEFQFIAPDNPYSMKLFEWCALHKVPVLAHCGYTGAEPAWMRRKSEPDRFIPVLEAFPTLQIMLAHTGLTRRKETLAVARRFPNQVWLDISGQPAGGVRVVVDGYDRSRICYGSDWPFYPFAVALARTLAAVADEPDYWPDLFYNNAARFLGMPPL